MIIQCLSIIAIYTAKKEAGTSTNIDAQLYEQARSWLRAQEFTIDTLKSIYNDVVFDFQVGLSINKKFQAVDTLFKIYTYTNLSQTGIYINNMFIGNFNIKEVLSIYGYNVE